MSTSSRAPFYDLFKLIVAIILLLLFLLLTRFQLEESPQPIVPAIISTPTPLPPTPTVAPASSTSTPPTTVTPAPTETSLPTNTVTPESTNPPAPTIESPTPEPLPTPTVEISSNPEACAILPPQLQVGMKATIKRRLNFRSSPGIKNNWILTNIPGTQVEVIGGPACTRYQNNIAYLWWQIKLPGGLVGWSAEASASGAFYFMEPVK